MILAIDFDGTIVEHMFPDIGKPVPGALEWMLKYQAASIKLVLWTMRSDNQKVGPVLSDAVKYCNERGIKFYGINENPDDKKWTTSNKAYANIYIDDAAFGCPLTEAFQSHKPMVDWGIVGPSIWKIYLDKMAKLEMEIQNGISKT